MGLAIDSEKRVDVAKLLESSEDFRDFVANALQNDIWLGDEQSKHMMETLMADNEQEFVMALCQIGFIVYTDYLIETRDLYKNKSFH
jgi:hypothetical protein